MAKSVDARSPGRALPGPSGGQVLPEWIERQVSHMRGERVYCEDGKVRTVARVRQVNRTRGMLWFVVTTVEDVPLEGDPEERSICEMDPDELMSAHARFIECGPDYLKSYRDQTVRFTLCEADEPG